jgi:hypothetical protein
MTCCGCGQETSMCVACSAAWNCPTPVCVDCAQRALREAAAVERALREVRVSDRLWLIWHRVRWAVLTRFERRPFEPPRRDTERGANPSEV